MEYFNFANHTVLRQALAHQFEVFAGRYTGGLFRGPAVASGRPVPIDGVVGASYSLCVNPHDANGIHGHVDGMPSGPLRWRPDFRDPGGHLDVGMLRWAAGGRYAEAPLLLPTLDLWRFLPGIRLRSRRDIFEASITQIRPVSLAAGGRPERLATLQIVIESKLGVHLLLLPCFSGTVPPGCGRLESGGHVLLALRRFGIGAAAVTGILCADQMALALDDTQEVVA